MSKNRTIGTREGHIVRVIWTDVCVEHYSSLAALFARHDVNAIGAKYNTVRCNMSRSRRYKNKLVTIEYIPIWIAVRGPGE